MHLYRLGELNLALLNQYFVLCLFLLTRVNSISECVFYCATLLHHNYPRDKIG